MCDEIVHCGQIGLTREAAPAETSVSRELSDPALNVEGAQLRPAHGRRNYPLGPFARNNHRTAVMVRKIAPSDMWSTDIVG
jgi:hypothetical protein